MNITMKFPGLEDVMVTKMEQVEDRVALHVELEVRPHQCPRCQFRALETFTFMNRLIRRIKQRKRCDRKFSELSNDGLSDMQEMPLVVFRLAPIVFILGIAPINKQYFKP
ncbi:hypothetical protein [Planococcus koreensis]|uniref:hypothetical protein n=1 Tax=Planococcus koreensis TaxID=112331 RepID=UPI0010814D3B|nr:hypothetical protein [Planococcus koreensis]